MGNAISRTTTTMVLATSTVVQVSTTIHTDIETTGVYTLIPSALTMTFKDVPAFVYLETELPPTTIYFTTTVTSTILGVNKPAPKTTAVTSSSAHSSSASASIPVSTGSTSKISSASSSSTHSTAASSPVNAASNTPSSSMPAKSNPASSSTPSSQSSSSTRSSSTTSKTSSVSPSAQSSPTASSTKLISSSSTSSSALPTTTLSSNQTTSILATCFSQGYTEVTSGTIFANAKDLNSCWNSCSSGSNCQSISFNVTSSLCTHFPDLFESIGSSCTNTFFGNAGNVGCYNRAVNATKVDYTAYNKVCFPTPVYHDPNAYYPPADALCGVVGYRGSSVPSYLQVGPYGQGGDCSSQCANVVGCKSSGHHYQSPGTVCDFYTRFLDDSELAAALHIGDSSYPAYFYDVTCGTAYNNTATYKAGMNSTTS